MGILSKLKNNKNSLMSQVKKLQSGVQEQDKRFLNYYDLKDGESMKVLIIPDVNGELFVKYKKHGPNLHYFDAQGKRQTVRGVPSIGTLPNDSESPVMQKGYDLLQLEKDTGEVYYKDEAKKWFPKEYTVMSCIVLDAPFEVNHSPDGNDVKLVNVPYNIEKYIINQIMDEVITEDELFVTPFVIKKTKNAGGWATYESSYFARKPLSDDELSDLEDSTTITMFDYTTIDIIPSTPTVAELEEWLAKAEAVYEKATSGTDTHDEPEEKEETSPPAKTGTSLRDRIKAKPVQQAPVEEEEDDLPFDEPQEDAVEPDVVEVPSAKSPLSERLAKLRAK